MLLVPYVRYCRRCEDPPEKSKDAQSNGPDNARPITYMGTDDRPASSTGVTAGRSNASRSAASSAISSRCSPAIIGEGAGRLPPPQKLPTSDSTLAVDSAEDRRSADSSLSLGCSPPKRSSS